MQALLAAIAAGDDMQAEAAVERLEAADEAGLIELARGGAEGGDARWWAVRSLARIGTGRAVDVLADAMRDEDAGLRAAAALAAAHIHSRDAASTVALAPQLAELLADDEGLVRQAAANALAMVGDDAVEALAGVLKRGPEGARTRAAYALRKIGTMKAAGVLFPLLNDDNYLVRAYAYEGLDALGLLDNLLMVP
jgi:HEAT repeat protein